MSLAYAHTHVHTHSHINVCDFSTMIGTVPNYVNSMIVCLARHGSRWIMLRIVIGDGVIEIMPYVYARAP